MTDNNQIHLSTIRERTDTIKEHANVSNEAVTCIKEKLWIHPIDERKTVLKNVRMSIAFEYCAEEDKAQFHEWDKTLTTAQRDNLRYWMHDRENSWNKARLQTNNSETFLLSCHPSISLDRMKSIVRTYDQPNAFCPDSWI
jgi:hypothetical protein